MKKRMLTAAMAGVMSISMMMSAFAAPGDEVSEGGAVPYSDGTEVYAGVILKDPDAKIKVKVPTLFAFVVNGSVDAGATDAISVGNGNLLLPNIKVEVDENDGSGTDNHSYSIQTVGEGRMYFENCSTARDDDNNGGRIGIPVSIKGSIRNEGSLASRNYWEHVGTAPGENDADFKHYQLSVDGKAFDKAENGGFSMSEAIDLEAPDLGRSGSVGAFTYTNLDAGNYAITGSQKDVEFDVKVGGQQNDYTQVEESAKVGTIVWTISHEVENDGVDTAPDNDYLAVPGVPTP